MNVVIYVSFIFGSSLLNHISFEMRSSAVIFMTLAACVVRHDRYSSKKLQQLFKYEFRESEEEKRRK